MKARSINYRDLEDHNFCIVFLGLILCHLRHDQLVDVHRRIGRMLESNSGGES